MTTIHDAGFWLQSAINDKDYNNLANIINYIIQNNIRLSISLERLTCVSHSYYYPTESSIFRSDQVLFIKAHKCSEDHRFCERCLNYYIIQQYNLTGIIQVFECPGCNVNFIAGSMVFNPDNYFQSLACFLGQDLINSHIREMSINSLCQNACPNVASIAHSVCIDNHVYCEICILSHIRSPESRIKCPLPDCHNQIYSQKIEDICQNDQVLMIQIWPLLTSETHWYLFCTKCSKNLKIEKGRTDVDCVCGQKFCILCKKDSHTGISCLGNASNNPRIIDLPAPDDLLNPKNLEEREYLNAQMLFSNSVPDMTFLSAKLIINKNLEEKYVKKKAEIAATLSDPCGETYVWHGSSWDTYEKIAASGFAIGGITPGVKVANASEFGVGVYTAKTPRLSFSYVRNTKFVLCCKAFIGAHTGTPARSIADLTAANKHYYMSGDVIVLFSPDQLVPMYLIEYEQR